MEEAAEEGESSPVDQGRGEEAGVVRFLRGIPAALVFYITEPFVWYGYVKNHRDEVHFGDFEAVFLMWSAVFEALGQGVFLILAVLTGVSWGDPSVGPGLLLLVGCRLLGNSVSSIPALRWATFEAVWRFDDYGNADLRKNLSWWSLSFTAVVVYSSYSDVAAYPEDSFWAALIGTWGLFMYPVMMYYERKVLLSDLERLCPGPLGDKFVAFRTVELFVVTPLLYFSLMLFG